MIEALCERWVMGDCCDCSQTRQLQRSFTSEGKSVRALGEEGK
jgi:hypothetical protein